jgi:hypothetical protein
MTQYTRVNNGDEDVFRVVGAVVISRVWSQFQTQKWQLRSRPVQFSSSLKCYKTVTRGIVPTSWLERRGFKPSGGRRIFKDGKTQGNKSSGRDFKLFDLCSKFTAR